MSWVAPLLALCLPVPALAEVPVQIAPTGHATVPVTGSFGTAQFWTGWTGRGW